VIKELENILVFIGAMTCAFGFIFIGWWWLAVIVGMVLLYYVGDLVFIIIGMIAILIYFGYNKIRGISLDESMKIIDNTLAKEERK